MNQFNPVITKRTPSDTVFAEVFLSPGPQAIGVTGQNRLQDFVGQEWMLLLDDETREVQLWRENGTWFRVPAPGHPLIDGIAPEGARRFTLCFDQAARPTVAYELDGVIRVTRWDAVSQQYISNVSFPGHDPALQLDAVWTGDIAGSDVLLFYLTPDRTGVRVRVQRELYAVENQIWGYPQPVILDRVIPAPLRYQALVSSADGRALPDVLMSDPYPHSASEFMAGAGEFAEAAYVLSRIVAEESPPPEEMVGSGQLTDARYILQRLVTSRSSTEIMSGLGGLTPASYVLQRMIVTRTPPTERMTGAGGLIDGQYRHWRDVIIENPDAARMTGTGGLTDAAYREV